MCVCILKTIFFSAAAINVYILRPVCICVAYARARLLLYFTKYKTHTDAIVCASYLYTFSIFIAYYEWQSMRILNIIKKRMKIWALVEVGKIAQFEMVLFVLQYCHSTYDFLYSKWHSPFVLHHTAPHNDSLLIEICMGDHKCVCEQGHC